MYCKSAIIVSIIIIFIINGPWGNNLQMSVDNVMTIIISHNPLQIYKHFMNYILYL